MNRILLMTVVGGLAPVLLAMAADSKTDVKRAIQKLADQPNYSWTSTARWESPGSTWRIGPAEGKAEKGGYTLFTFAMGDSEYSMAFRGHKSAFKSRDQWQSPEELEAQDRGWIARRMRVFKAPVAEAEDLLNKSRELKAEADGSYAGALTEEGVKALFAAGRRSNPNAQNVHGQVRFWVRDGRVAKYEYDLSGQVNLGQTERDIEMKTSATVEIKAVGTTRVVLPDDARKILN